MIIIRRVRIIFCLLVGLAALIYQFKRDGIPTLSSPIDLEMTRIGNEALVKAAVYSGTFPDTYPGDWSEYAAAQIAAMQAVWTPEDPFEPIIAEHRAALEAYKASPLPDFKTTFRMESKSGTRSLAPRNLSQIRTILGSLNQIGQCGQKVREMHAGKELAMVAVDWSVNVTPPQELPALDTGLTDYTTSVAAAKLDSAKKFRNPATAKRWARQYEIWRSILAAKIAEEEAALAELELAQEAWRDLFISNTGQLQIVMKRFRDLDAYVTLNNYRFSLAEVN